MDDLVDTSEQARRKRYNRRLNALESEASTWFAHWQELNDWIRPRRYRYLYTSNEVNKGTKRNDKIINSRPLISQRVASSGMHAGISSPARPWMRFMPSNPLLADRPAVMKYCSDVEEIIYDVIARSNIYDCLPKIYAYLIVFGTACMILDEDDEDVVRGYVLPLGQYVLANNDRLLIDTIFRKFSMTVLQCKKKFGLEKLSQSVRDLYRKGEWDKWVEVVHVIEPNDNYDPQLADFRGMPYRSVWYEKNGPDELGFLREKGYHEFPAMCPRWEIDGEDVYGSSPGMDALGDAKSLQNLEKRKGQIMDRLVNPPMVGPPNMQRASLLPGDVTQLNVPPGGQKFEAAVKYEPQAMPAAAQVTMETERRIAEIFFEDLWRMLSQNDQNPQAGVQPITAREVSERHEEKMLQLGPVLERVHGELLEPMITRIYNILARRGWLPPAPPELRGQEMKIEFISIMAQAQKLLGTVGIERMMSFVGNIAAVHPDVLDKIDVDVSVAHYARMVGVPADCIRDDEVVQAMRDAKNQQAQAQTQGQAALAATQGAKVLSETDMRGDTALSRLMGAVGGGVPPAQA